MTFLLDTNTCIRYLNGLSPSIKSHLQLVSPDQVKLCSIVKAELLFGAAKSGVSERTRAALNVFFAPFESICFDDPAAQKYAHIRATLENRGTPIGPNDLMIAAIAVAYRVTLVTHNTREFSRVEDLSLEDWQ